MKIGITSDHGGYKLKNKLIKSFRNKYDILDYGTDSEESVDYPDFAFKLGEAILRKDIDFGIAICKTGIGMSISLNKVKGIRCAKIDNLEDAYYSKNHNNVNVIAISGKKSFIKAKGLVNTFIKTEVSKEKRHINRVNKIKEYENEH